MSDIQRILKRREQMADRGVTPTNYQRSHDLLAALDILCDILERIAKAEEVLAGLVYKEKE